MLLSLFIQLIVQKPSGSGFEIPHYQAESFDLSVRVYILVIFTPWKDFQLAGIKVSAPETHRIFYLLLISVRKENSGPETRVSAECVKPPFFPLDKTPLIPTNIWLLSSARNGATGIYSFCSRAQQLCSSQRCFIGAATIS